MTPEFDEEVVFENSPLYQYLQDLGHTDFEVCSAVSQKAEQCAAKGGQQEWTAHAAQKQGILSKLAEFFRSWFPFPQYKKNDDILHRLDVGFRFDTLRTILQQEVLLQEDVELIELLDPSILSAGQCKQQENGQLPTLRSLATPNIWDVSLSLAFVSGLLMLPSWWKESSWPLWGLVLLVYAVLRVWGTWRTAKLQMSLRKYCLQLEETVANSRAFTNLVRKALRLIQETEVISRGFTLLLDRVSAACPFNKAGQHPSQHLIGLRKAVYRSVRANFRASRLATLYMLKNVQCEIRFYILKTLSQLLMPVPLVRVLICGSESFEVLFYNSSQSSFSLAPKYLSCEPYDLSLVIPKPKGDKNPHPMCSICWAFCQVNLEELPQLMPSLCEAVSMATAHCVPESFALKELGLGLSEEQVSEEEAHNLTDGFSLPALKVLFQLWVGQSSEFFRRLVLLLSPANASPKPLMSPECLPHHILSDVTQGLPHTHAACLEELKRSYEFYRYFETQHQSGFERTTRTKQKSKELNSLHTAVRSLQLHLKALLNEVIILEDELEKLVSTKETHELTTEAHQVLEQKLKFIQPHIQASNSCWEEAISQVEKMSRRNPDKKACESLDPGEGGDSSPAATVTVPCCSMERGKLEASCDNVQHTTVPLIQPTLHIEDKDPIPEEQELEAYVDDSDMDNEYKREDFYCFSQEERERQKQEREESKRVLQELKSVLGFKASEAERQKWKQLLFSDHAAVKPLSPVEPLKLLNNLESPMNSVTENQDCSESCDISEERDSNLRVNAADKSRTEYLYEDPEMEKDSTTDEGISTEAEKRAYYQCEGEGEELKLSDVDGVEVSQPTFQDALHSKIKHRLAQLHISTDFNFTSGLAAQVAARSLTFSTMQEQTFGDEEDEEEEEKIQENENLMEECENEDRGFENEEKVQV